MKNAETILCYSLTESLTDKIDHWKTIDSVSATHMSGIKLNHTGNVYDADSNNIGCMDMNVVLAGEVLTLSNIYKGALAKFRIAEQQAESKQVLTAAQIIGTYNVRH